MPIGHFVENGLKSVACKATLNGEESKHQLGMDSLKPNESITTGDLLVATASWLEQWDSFEQPQHCFVDDDDKKVLIDEPALLKNFFNNEIKDEKQ